MEDCAEACSFSSSTSTSDASPKRLSNSIYVLRNDLAWDALLLEKGAWDSACAHDKTAGRLQRSTFRLIHQSMRRFLNMELPVLIVCQRAFCASHKLTQTEPRDTYLSLFIRLSRSEVSARFSYFAQHLAPRKLQSTKSGNNSIQGTAALKCLIVECRHGR